MVNAFFAEEKKLMNNAASNVAPPKCAEVSFLWQQTFGASQSTARSVNKITIDPATPSTWISRIGCSVGNVLHAPN